MNTIQVKICGIRRLDSAFAAINAGADFLGFNFVPSSKRFASPAEALQITKKIKGKVKLVGVFQNATITEINKIADLLQLDFVQLHGKENPEFVQKIKTNVIKTFTSEEASIDKINEYKISYVLLDRNTQGKGKKFPIGKAQKMSSEFPTILAGGLTVRNVTKLIKAVRPFGVDVAGGIETNGIEDVTKIKEFIQTVKGVRI